jgi:hypothetical protein
MSTPLNEKFAQKKKEDSFVEALRIIHEKNPRLRMADLVNNKNQVYEAWRDDSNIEGFVRILYRTTREILQKELGLKKSSRRWAPHFCPSPISCSC